MKILTVNFMAFEWKVRPHEVKEIEKMFDVKVVCDDQYYKNGVIHLIKNKPKEDRERIIVFHPHNHFGMEQSNETEEVKPGDFIVKNPINDSFNVINKEKMDILVRDYHRQREIEEIIK